jgi:hypothetical protein
MDATLRNSNATTVAGMYLGARLDQGTEEASDVLVQYTVNCDTTADQIRVMFCMSSSCAMKDIDTIRPQHLNSSESEQIHRSSKICRTW